MKQLGNNLLSRAALAADKDGHSSICDPAHFVPNAPHRFGVSEDYEIGGQLGDDGSRCHQHTLHLAHTHFSAHCAIAFFRNCCKNGKATLQEASSDTAESCT